MSKTTIIEALQILLANNYSLYLNTQNCHWNVEGPHFKSLHEMFEEQYTELAAAIDEVAELIRGLGAKVPANFGIFSDMNSIKDIDEGASADEMVRALVAGHESILKSLDNCLEAAQDEGDEVVIGHVVDRMSVHRKTRWMLNSTI